MKKGLAAVAIVIVGVLAAAVFLGDQSPERVGQDELSGGEGNGPPPEEIDEVAKAFKGVSLSPRSFQGQDFADFFPRAKQAGGVLTWAGDWWHLVDEEGAAHVVTDLALHYDLEPVVLATYFDQSTGELVRPMNETIGRRYIEAAVEYVTAHEPRFVGFGIEINSYWMRSPEGYAGFVEFLGELYPRVKEASPDTKVFTVFQLERMKGLHGGLFGGTHDESLSQWELLDDFPYVDALAFTTYPCLVFEDPSEMPEHYYAEIREHTSKEVLFIEIGWFREGPEGWESDGEEQARFIRRLFDLTEDLEPPLLIWSFLYDPEAQPPFDSMGLLDADEAHDEAWEAWTGG